MNLKMIHLAKSKNSIFQTGSEYAQPIVRKKPNEDKRNPDDDGNASEGDFMSEAKVENNTILRKITDDNHQNYRTGLENLYLVKQGRGVS